MSADGHVSLVAHLDASGDINTIEEDAIKLAPMVEVDDVGYPGMALRLVGEVINLDAGKTITVRVHPVTGSLSVGSAIATFALTANGFFSVSADVTPPGGATEYWMSFQTDDATGPLPQIRGLMWVIEVSP